MKNRVYKSFFIVTLFIFTALLLTRMESAAMEMAGCLTCHNSPGLVRLNEDKSLTVLHIDEEAYLNSPHGQFRCRKCHIKTKKIPHSGVRNVSCNSRCHKEKKDKALIKKEKYGTIHKGQQSVITKMESGSVCNECHPIYPHSREVFKRAVLNLHAGYITCEVCHLDEKKYKVIRHGWSETKGVEFKGKPFGRRSKGGVSRIISYVKEWKEGAKVVEARSVSAAAGREAAKVSEGTINGIDDLWHKDIVKMNINLACKSCHSKGSIMDFKELGFSREKISELTGENILTIISGRDNFFLPGL